MRNALTIAALTVALPIVFFALIALATDLAPPDNVGLQVLIGAAIGVPTGLLGRALMIRSLKRSGDLP